MMLRDGGEIILSQKQSEIRFNWIGNNAFCRFYLTKSQALELAAELVKLAMPDAKPDTAPVSIM